ncbi:MAG TPA: 4Fe-4S binding protein [Chitinispirillaceae bacterium]|nr:4Fe-4S binding protein [Chitinispirillaceae bacterium]
MGKKRLTAITFVITLISLILTGCGLEPRNATLQVKPTACIGCNECGGVCGYDAIRIINGKAVIDPSKCVKCGRCVELCPAYAIY